MNEHATPAPSARPRAGQEPQERKATSEPKATREHRRQLPLQFSEIVLIASVACLVAAAAIQAVVALVVELSAK